MRRSVALLTSALVSSAVVASPLLTAPASASADGLVPLASLGCALGSEVCGLVGDVSTPLAPLDPLLGEPAPLPLPAIPGASAPAAEPTAPTPTAAPTTATAPKPAPAPAPTKATGTATTPAVASNTRAATGFEASRSFGSTSSRSTSAAVPNVPAGSTLDLTPLGLPRIELTTPRLTSGAEAYDDPAAEQLMVPAASTAVTDLPGDSRATVVILAISTLVLAAGLLLDQLRRASQPFHI
jgi:hypothetical protein